MATTKRRSAADPSSKKGRSERNSQPQFKFGNSFIREGVQAIASCISTLGTPVAAALHKAVVDGDWLATTSFSVDPDSYSDPQLYAVDYLAAGLLRKYQHLPIESDCVGVAIAMWQEAERNCRSLNRSGGFDKSVADPAPRLSDRTLEATVWLAREKIRKLLGQFNWNEVSDHFGFSAGASTRLPRKTGHPFYKYSGKPEVTRSAALLSVCAIWSIPLWRRSMQDLYGQDPCNWVTIVEGSKVTTVSKTAIVDRVIAIEPDMNMFMQRGVGAVIRKRLKRVGIDLNDQTRNQELALAGSLDGSLATIDLRMASDSISLELVRAILPPEWFAAVEQLRCEECTLPGGIKHRLEKVSSMGNGYTFELESLIFWALTSASVDLHGDADKRIGIYGDDIVVCSTVAEHLIRVLAYCGFTTNKEKTFLNGPFRESCGMHYFRGTNVTPFYVKEQDDDTACLYWLANSFREWVDGKLEGAASQQCYSALVDLCRRRSKGRLCYTPSYLGKNAGLVCNFDEVCPQWDPKRQMWFTHRLIARRKAHKPTGLPAILAWLSVSRHETELVVEKGEPRYFRELYYTSAWCLTSKTVNLSGLS